jgi:hypothetical protein
MKLPWDNKSGLAKTTIMSTVILLLSSGLCSANLALFGRYGAISGGGPVSDRTIFATNSLMVTGFLELIGMVIGAIGLISVIVTALIKLIRNCFNPRPEDTQ